MTAPIPARPGARSRALLRLLAGIYLAAICLVWLVSRSFAEGRWWATLLLYAPQVLYAAPAVALVPIALARRDRPALSLHALSVALVVLPLMGFNVPAPRPRAADRRVRVLAHNIRKAEAGIEPIARQIERSRPDVVVFSEARRWGREPDLQAELVGLLPGWSFLRGGDVFVASRWPFFQEEVNPLAPFGERDPSIQRSMVLAGIAAPHLRFHVAGVHLRTAVGGRSLVRDWPRLDRYMRHTSSIRRLQVEDVLARMEKRSGPCILAGDFNTPPAGRIYRMLTGELDDAFARRGWGWGFTYPAAFPVLRIDYIFHTRDWTTLDCRVGPRPGSDHRAVFAELGLRAAQ